MGDSLAKFPLQSLAKAPKPLPHATTWISLTDVSLDERSQIHSIYMKFRGTFLVIQWLRLCTLNAGAWLKSLIRELDPTCLK